MADEQEPSRLQSWTIGDVVVTKFLDFEETADLALMFADATTEALNALPWLRPNFVTSEGLGILSYHSLVVQTPTKRVLVDTCWGNDKDLGPYEAYAHRQTSFLQDLELAGYPRESFDVVLCTHLHADHVGWNTMLVDGKWVPTFPNARYIFGRTEFEYWLDHASHPARSGFDELQALTIRDSVRPVYEAGLVELVDDNHRICDELALVPTHGHTAGHVSVHISSRGEEAFITGDIAHHPCQLGHPEWGIREDYNFDEAVETRRRAFSAAANQKLLMIGSHWAGVTAGIVRRSGDAFALECNPTV